MQVPDLKLADDPVARIAHTNLCPMLDSIFWVILASLLVSLLVLRSVQINILSDTVSGRLGNAIRLSEPDASNVA